MLMDSEDLFDYLVATDQLDDFLGYKKDEEEFILEEYEQKIDEFDEEDDED